MHQALLETLSEKLKALYVFPEKAEEMAAKLAENNYDDITDKDALAAQLTEDLQTITHDLHLRMSYNPKMFDQLKASQENPDDTDQQAEHAATLRYENYYFKKVERLDGNVGYIKLNGFVDAVLAGDTAIAALQFVADCDAIIFDLRTNGGGSPTLIQLICSYLFDEAKHLNSFYWRPDDSYQQFWTQTHVQGKKLVDTPVYILTSRLTFSAAEEFTYNLKNMERATIIGETTGGGAHPGGVEALIDGFVVFMPQGRAINPITDTNWEGTGITPHIQVDASEALKTAHIHAIETQLEETEDDKHAWELASIKAVYDPPQINHEMLKRYVGTYGTFAVHVNDDQLTITDQIGSRPLVAITETLFADSFNATRRFEFNDVEMKILSRDNPHTPTLPRQTV